ncbi:MAG: TolC family protein [Chitinophagales bacterium]|nr:TolC family protein [Chitinophagales bacterium]
MKFGWLGILVICFPGWALSQSDSARVLSVNDFIGIVKKYHPIAKQAALIPEQAKAELLIARGGWDPKIYSDYNRKTYDGQNYYSYFENSMSVPVWYGIEIKGGYDFVYGGNINNESKLPDDGLGYLGISVPLLKNMLMDKQRAVLKQAQIFQNASEQQRLIILNNLLLEALKIYYDWSYAYYEYDIYKIATEVAKVRFDATVSTVNLGDRAAIDTIEALTQLQYRQFQLNEARLKFLNSGLELSNYLWLENNLPRGFDTAIVPAPLNSDYVDAEIDLVQADKLANELTRQQPYLLNYQYQLQQLEVERKLKLENLKPVLNAAYNVLSERFNFRSNSGIVFSNNYKLGLNFSMPLSFMQARGDLKLMKIKIQEKQLERNLKAQELAAKLKQGFNELIVLRQQTALYTESINGFKNLFDGESTRFNNGESSLFLVNARENRYLEAQIKLRELQAKYYKTEAAVKWTIGNIAQ